MSKFKVGDKVRIVNPVNVRDRYLKGKLGEVIDIIDNMIYLDIKSNSDMPHWWENELELVEESETDHVCYEPYDIPDLRLSDIPINSNGITIGNNLFTMNNDGTSYFTIIDDIEEKGEKDMNKVLELYKNRKIEELNDKLNEKMDKDYEKIEVVKEYNKLVEKFEKDLEDLFKNVENFDNDYLVSNYTDNLYKYKINQDKIKDELREKYQDEYNESRKELDKLIEEVDAQLSMSDDLGYQINVLTRYEILDKKDEKLKG